MAKLSFELEIPADVPRAVHDEYIKNYSAITRNTGRLMLFACDQKIEHLNNDFYGPGIAPDAAHPEHIFAIAQQGTIGALATSFGLIARYGSKYSNINYLVKLNSKTDLVKTEQKDPFSQQLWTMQDLITFKKNSGLSICAIGYTIYLGSEFEHEMLHQAAQAIFDAHQHGLITVLWIYPRGKSITDDQEPHLVAGATGIANALGADFVKVKPPKDIAAIDQAVKAAGNTKIICAGGKMIDAASFLQELYEQLQHGTQGNATGRNIFQKSLPEAVSLTKAIAAIVFENKDPKTALSIYTGK
ncbi:MAG TPA: hypothetical protein VFF04_05580 [Candidatus Babeliales bacterium]|nr:hypothetical protein [Candidatus Babeliales bacterium]